MREYIQLQAINDISKVYFSDNNIYMAELGTGSGKTKILLDSAFEILKKTQISYCKYILKSACFTNESWGWKIQLFKYIKL